MNLQVINNNFLDLLKNIEVYFDSSDNFLHNARNKIKIIDYNEQLIVIKAFKIPNIINQIVYSFFRDSKAKKSYDNSIKIIDFVPKPIGYIEFKKFGLFKNSYFVSENFNYDFTIREPLVQDDFLNKDEIFKQFAKFTLKLHDAGIYHLDYSPGNILIKKDKNNNYIFKIVDINRMQFKKLSLDERMKNFSKLWAKDDYLKIIIKEYATLYNQDYNICLDVALKYSQLHKDKKNLKKRLKGKKIND